MPSRSFSLTHTHTHKHTHSFTHIHKHTHFHLIYRDNQKVFMANLLDNHNSVILISNFVISVHIKSKLHFTWKNNARIRKKKQKKQMFHFLQTLMSNGRSTKNALQIVTSSFVCKNSSGNTSPFCNMCKKEENPFLQ